MPAPLIYLYIIGVGKQLSSFRFYNFSNCNSDKAYCSVLPNSAGGLMEFKLWLLDNFKPIIRFGLLASTARSLVSALIPFIPLERASVTKSITGSSEKQSNHPHSRWFICSLKFRFSEQQKTPQWRTGPCPNKKPLFQLWMRGHLFVVQSFFSGTQIYTFISSDPSSEGRYTSISYSPAREYP